MVRHAAGSYAVIVRAGAQADLPALVRERHPGARAVVVSDATVAAALPLPLPGADLLTFPAGEAHKSRQTWSDLTDRLIAGRYGRDSVLVAFGGGVTCDLAGFVAATFLRGIPWIAVPTSTLAMLDAAVGGKTAVDTPGGKNLVGAFHPPSSVLCDPATLASLPERNFREGLAEAVKHAATLDPRYGAWISENAAAIGARDRDAITLLVHRSVELKAAIVTDDEFEGAKRSVLNAGHTVAHAIEQATSFVIPHGEAVAIGLVLETRVAEKMGIAAAGTADRVAELLTAVKLPTRVPEGIDHAVLLASMETDKKNRGGVVHAALLASFGETSHDGDQWTYPLDLAALGAMLTSMR